MIEIKVDDSAMLKQFDEVQKRITGLQTETSTTFFNWQVEDMHRHYPSVDGGGLLVSTDIHQHSRLNQTRRTGRRKPRRIVASTRPTTGQHRPILRPELFEKLKDRMVEMVKEACTWQ